MHHNPITKLLRLLSSTYRNDRPRHSAKFRIQQAVISLQQLEPRVLLSATDVEPNDRVVTAGNFGNLTDVVIANSVFGSISAHDTMDVYKFTVDRNCQANIQLQHLTGSVFLKISKDNDGDQLLRSFEEIEDISVTGDFTAVESLSPGTYFVTILRNNSDVRTDYQLTIQVNEIADAELTDPGTRTNTAVELGPLTDVPISRTEVVSAFDNDYFSFTLANASNVSIDVTGVDEELEMVLGQDLNNDNILEVFEQTNISDSFQTIEALGPGKYFVTFRSINTTFANNNDNTDYQLQLSATPLTNYSDAGNTLGTSRELLTGATPLQDILSDGDVDMYRFTVTFAGQITIRLDGVNEPVQAILSQDSNGNGSFDPNEALDTRGTSGSVVVSKSLAAGTYYIALTPAASMTNTAYQISLENNLPTNLALSSQSVSEAATIGTLVGAFSATDPAGVVRFTYTLVSGVGSADNARFEIVGNELRTKTRFDFETSPSHSIRVRVTTDSGESIEQKFVISVLDVLKPDDWVSAGVLKGGIAVKDSARGIGYLMYSEQSVHARFGRAAEKGNAEHFVAVQFQNGKWRFANDNGWVKFVPNSGDRLIARLDFSKDTATLLTGQFGIIEGIQHGIAGGDLSITPNRWFGSRNSGEFGLSGTFFVPGQDSTPLGHLNKGIASKDDATGIGYVMYSQQSIYQRFTGAVSRGNADHLLAVQLISGHWFYANDDRWVNFIPDSNDQLLARVNFDTDAIELLRGQRSQIQGINAGFNNSDLSVRSNYWARFRNAGEFSVTGSFWN